MSGNSGGNRYLKGKLGRRISEVKGERNQPQKGWKVSRTRLDESQGTGTTVGSGPWGSPEWERTSCSEMEGWERDVKVGGALRPLLFFILMPNFFFLLPISCEGSTI